MMPFEQSDAAMKWLIREHIAPALTQAGYKKSGIDFSRRHARGWSTLSIQRWRWSPEPGQGFASPQHVRFTINLGIFLDEIERAGPPHPVPRRDPPHEADCHWRERIGNVMPQHEDVWWDVTDQVAAERLRPELESALRVHAFPLLERLSDPARMLAHIRSSIGDSGYMALSGASLAKALDDRECFAFMCRRLWERGRGSKQEGIVHGWLDHLGWSDRAP